MLAASTSYAASETKTWNVVLTKDNTLVMNTYFDTDSVAIVAQKAKDLDGILQSNEPLYLVIDSGGGSIEAGIELIQNLNSLNRPVHTVSLFSASMGFQTVQGVKGKRLLLPFGTLMSHKAYGGFRGEFPGQLDSRYGYYLRRVAALDNQVVKRTNGKHTAKSYASLIENEYWCDGADCITQGFGDGLANVSCDKSLSGTRVESEKFIFMGMAVEIQLIMSACPVITGVLDYKVLIDGEPLFKKERQENTYYYESRTSKISKDDMDRLNQKIKTIVDQRTNTSKREIIKY